jgi:orotidine-5'-phosphate decarboxylase
MKEQNEYRLIYALDDVTNIDQANKLIDQVDPAVKFYKFGEEFFINNSLTQIRHRIPDAKIFADVKLYNTPNVVTNTCKILSNELGVDFITVHAFPQNVISAVQGVQGTKTKILAVTVLTSHSDADIIRMGYHDFEIFGDETRSDKLVRIRAQQAVNEGAHGLVCSGHEVYRLRYIYGDDLILVTPGIRFADQSLDDQNRVVTPQEAFENGTDYIVVGRGIRRAENPYIAAEQYIDVIKKHFK